VSSEFEDDGIEFAEPVDPVDDDTPDDDSSTDSEAIVLSTGYLTDYISGQRVRATPEETEAVQVFCRRLVEDYGYPRDHIQTRPQFRVRKRPSDERRSYPTDIAVFSGPSRIEENLYMIIECKKKNRSEGREQLQLYLDMSPAELGVWFNGDEHIYVQKLHHPDGSRTYRELPNLPRYRQRIEDIGLYKRRDLKVPSNLRAVFRDLRNHLAGMTTGVTRDEALAREIINVLFCKIFDEQECRPNDIVKFRAGVDETPEEIHKRIMDLFEQMKSMQFSDVFGEHDTISLDPASLAYVVGELQNYEVTAAERDAIGDAFETFIGPALRGAEGQFFTPRNVVKMVVDMIDPRAGETVLDPACGSGGFLIAALAHMWTHLRAEADERGWTERELARREQRAATDSFRGIDKDGFLAQVTKAYMALVGDGRGGIFCANSLQNSSDWPTQMSEGIGLGQFDVLVTNPPFGKKIVVKGKRLLAQYDLGRRWKREEASGEWNQTSNLQERQPPQIIFLERCLQFLKPGGRLGIVLPESLLGMPTHGYVVTWLRSRAKIRGVIAMPEELFKTSGKGGTHAKVCVLLVENTAPEESDVWPIFMAEAKWCGHDSRGKPTYRKTKEGDWELLDDIPKITERFFEVFGTAQRFWES
jgi:type I restriction enzyme M protein